MRELLSYLSTFGVRRDYGRFKARVDPRAVRYPRTSREWPAYVRRWPLLVCPGGWDRSRRGHAPFRERQMRQLFVENRHYTETDEYRRLVRQLEESGRSLFPPCRSREEIARYFEGVRTLYESMRKWGCVSPGELPRGEPADDGRHHGITVRIGRDGAALKSGQGTHRLAIARVLELSSVPVVVDLVHPAWVRARCHGRIRGLWGAAVLDALFEELSLERPPIDRGIRVDAVDHDAGRSRRPDRHG